MGLTKPAERGAREYVLFKNDLLLNCGGEKWKNHRYRLLDRGNKVQILTASKNATNYTMQGWHSRLLEDVNFAFL